MVKQFFILIGVLFSIHLMAQTGIGTTTPHASAKLEVFSENKGFLPPRMTAQQRTAISSPAVGLMVYQTDGTSGLYYHGSSGWVYIINSNNNVLSVANGGTGVTSSTGTGNVVLSSSPTISLATITSGSNQFPQSINISPTTHATSKRAAIWLDGWSILQDVQGNGTKNFSIGETIPGTPAQYPPRLVIAQGNGNIGLGTISPTARLNLVGGGIKIHNGFTNNTARPSLTTSTIGNYEIRGVGSIEGSTQEDAGNDGFLRLSAGGGTSTTAQSSIDLSGYSNQPEMNNNIVMRTAGEERLRISATGNVGIGTSTPSNTLHLENGNSFGTAPDATTSPSLYIYNNNSASTTAHSTLTLRTNNIGGGNPYVSFDIRGIRGYSMGIDNADAYKFKFHTNWNFNNSVSPAFTVTTDNRVGIGTTSPIANLHVQSTDHTSVYIESTTTDNYGLIRLNANTSLNWTDNWHELIVFEKQGSQIGKIFGSSSGTAVTYGTNSDYRLKKDFQDFNALDIVKKLKAYNYAWKSDNSRMYGFIAHELQNELPYAVSGKKDQIGKNGKMLPQTVDYGKLTPILLKAIQEQDLKINELQKQIDALMKRLEMVEH
jgi:hypothetical protein